MRRLKILWKRVIALKSCCSRVGAEKQPALQLASFSVLLLTRARWFLWFLKYNCRVRLLLGFAATPRLSCTAWTLNKGTIVSSLVKSEDQTYSTAAVLANTPAIGDLKERFVSMACKWRHFQSTQNCQYGPFKCPGCLSLLGIQLQSERTFSETKGQGCLLNNTVTQQTRGSYRRSRDPLMLN